MKKIFSLCLFLILCTAVSVSAHAETDDCNVTISLEKVYLSPSQIHITSDGIFFLNSEGNLESACGIFHDTSGVYAIKKEYRCKFCGWLTKDGRCYNPNCRLNK